MKPRRQQPPAGFSASPAAGSPQQLWWTRAWVADLALLGITFIWGATFPVVKAALDDASPLLFSAARLTVAAAALALVFRPRWRRLPARIWMASAILGLCLGGGYALQTAGLATIGPAISAFLTSLSVMLVPILLAFFWARGLAPNDWAGAVLAMLGLALLLLGPGLGSVSQAGLWLGYALTGLCALAFALHIINLGEWAPRFPVGDLATLQIAFAALFNWIAALFAPAPRWHNTSALWLIVIFTAVLATSLAFTTQTWAQQHTSATHVAIIFAFEPVFAALASWWGWHQGLRPLQWLGAVLIVAATFVIEAGKRRMGDTALP